MVKNRISSQYVFGYQKFILYPEDYKATKSGKKKVLLPELVGKGYGTFWRWKGRYRVCKGSRASKKSNNCPLVHHQYDEVPTGKYPCGQKDFQNPERFLFHRIEVGDSPPWR